MEAHCMFCRELWDPIFMRRQLSGKFMNDTYKKHREEMLWEQQRARLPETMPLIDALGDIDTMYEEVHELQRELKIIQKKLGDTYHSIRRRENQYHRMLRRVNRGEEPMVIQEDKAEEEQPHYRRGCSKEDCPGYIHSRTGRCGSCQTFTCLACNHPLGKETSHECRVEDRDQWKLIQETSRPCPGCRIRISKESGCDQMWCPNCRTAFRWSTGTIERGTVHNPHYYEWLFQQGGNHHDQDQDAGHGGRCFNPGELAPRAARLVHRRTEGPENSNEYDVEFLRMHREIMHHFNVTLPRIPLNIGSERKRNEMYTQLRLDYLHKKIPLADVKTRLQRIDKAHRKTVEYNRICETYIHVSVEILDRFVMDSSMTKKQAMEEMEAVKTIASNAVKDLNAVYKSRLHLI